MKWNHILENQPEHESQIIQIDRPYKGHYGMGMRKYSNYGNSWEDHLEWCDNNNAKYPDFWWIYAKDFPFPDQI